MMRNHQLTTCPGFSQAIEARFAHSPYEDPTGLLFKLTQRGSVRDYLNQFEALANKIVGVPPPLLLSCFISGLDLEIHREVQAMQPVSLVHVTGLARLQEEKFSKTRKPFCGHQPSIAPPPPPPTSNLTLTIPSPTPTQTLLPLVSKSPPFPFR